MGGRCLLYGATGYTGRLVARQAARRGLDVVLAGRNRARLAEIASELRLPHRVVALETPGPLIRSLEDVSVVLNAAGPFRATAGPVVEACLETGAHYLDVTGEIEVFRNLHRRDPGARARGVMLMPGVGLIVLPTDCLALRMSRKVGNPTRLTIAISRTPLVSRGSARTMVDMVGGGVWLRRRGRMERVLERAPERAFDFGLGPSACMAVNWADVYTAHFSTGVPNITVFLEVAPWERAWFLANLSAPKWARTKAWLSFLKIRSNLLPEGPSARQRARHPRVILVEAQGHEGRRASARLETPDSYDATAITAVAAIERVLAGDHAPGFRTPAEIFGPDFVRGLSGFRWTESDG